MQWWAWIVVAAVLLTAEMLVPTDFYLAVLGAGAAAVGLLMAAGFDGPVWSEWLFFGIFSALFLVAFRRLWPRVADRHGQGDSIVGEIAVASEVIAVGGLGTAQLRGTPWSARNVSDVGIESGQRLRVVAVDGLTINVEAEVPSVRS